MNKRIAQSEPAPVGTPPGRFSSGELAFLVGVPLLWAILLLFHPGGEGEQIYLDAQDDVTRFLVVHIEMMLFIPLMAVVVYLLLRGVEGTAARVSRIALVPFAVFYSAWEVFQGIGVGILVNELKGLPQAEQALREDLVQDFAEHALIGPFGVFGSIGSMGLIVAAIAAGVALYRHAGAPVSVPILLGVSGAPDHRPPAALRTHRARPLHRRRPALRAKPIGSPGTRSVCSRRCRWITRAAEARGGG
jgi:hypothetical protein